MPDGLSDCGLVTAVDVVVEVQGVVRGVALVAAVLR